MAARTDLLDRYSRQFRDVHLHRARIAAERSGRLEAEQAAATKSNFLATMSHELRTPLNAIIGFADLLVTPSVRGEPGKVAERAGFIKEAGGHLLATINKILEMSAIQSGTLAMERHTIDICDLVERAIRLSAFDRNGALARISLRCQDRSAFIVGDETKTTQAITNILSNAIKYNDDASPIDVRVATVEGSVEVSIVDRGIGMTAEELKIALTPFGRVRSAYTAAVGGTGLGLCIAKDLTELQGGSIAIDSAKGRGTEVRLRFPAARVACATTSI